MCYYVSMKEKSQKPKSIKLNYIYNVSYQILTLITPLITAPYLSRVLKVDGIGAYSYTYSLVSYFIMFAALGTVNYGNREISYLQDDRTRRTRTFWEIELLSMISVSVCLCAYLIFTLAFPHTQLKQQLLLIESIYLISIAADITWLFQGMEEFGKIVGRNVIFKIINIIFIFTAVRTQKDLLIYVAGICLLELFANISIWFYLPQYVDRPRLGELHPFSHFRATLILFVPTIATTIYTALDKTMLNSITGSMTENGYYEQAGKIYKMMLMVVTSLGTVMLPRIGKCFSENKKDEVKQLLYKSFQFVWFIGLPLCFGLIGIARNFSPWFFGDGYEKVPYLLMIMAFLLPVIGLSNVIGIQYLVTTKRENLLTRSVCIGAIANFFLNLLLIPYLYSYGAAIASVISEVLITAIQFWFIRHEMSIPKIFSLSWKYLFASISMLVILLLLDQKMSVSFLSTVIMICIGFVIYMVLLIMLKDEMIWEGIEMIKGIRGKRKRGD